MVVAPYAGQSLFGRWRVRIAFAGYCMPFNPQSVRTMIEGPLPRAARTRLKIMHPRLSNSSINHRLVRKP